MSNASNPMAEIINNIKLATAEDKLVWKKLAAYLEDNENEALIDFMIENDPYNNGGDAKLLETSVCAALDEALFYFLNDSANQWKLCAQLITEDGLGPIQEIEVPRMDMIMLLQEVLQQQKRNA
ncbi:MAG: hypothetical protein IJM08_00415 [Firmicutes bacterium]|nr:hypothetical protein [Bacillota bacterium]